MFSAKDVKELREKTGAGMLDCKKALEACEGSQDKAVDWLREKGIAKAAKKESRIAAEGICVIKTKDNKGVIVEVNSETDFVAKNKEFTDFVDALTNTILNSDVKTMDDAMNLKLNGETVSSALVALTAKIGEKLSFRRFEVVEKQDDEVFGDYLHLGGKIGSLVVCKGVSEEVARDVAMQTAAMAPLALSRDLVDKDTVAHEEKIIKEQVLAEGKPENIAEKMVQGRINKFFKEVCLEEQQFVKDSGLSVKDYVKNNGGTIEKMVRFAVGEGIEKKEEDFASEVMSQING